MHYEKDYGLIARIARFHNIYGPEGTWKGGREKAPAAFTRKAIASTVGRPCVVRAQVFAQLHSQTLRSGATASRPVASATSMTAWRASCASCTRITTSR